MSLPWRIVSRGGVALLFAFLMLPLAVVVAVSFTPGAFFVLPSGQLSLRWYAEVLQRPEWRQAAWTSLVVGLSAMALATVLGTSAALGLSRLRSGRLRAGLAAVLVAPSMVPVVITGVAMFLFYARFGLAGTFAGLVIAHTALGMPFVVLSVGASLQMYDAGLTRAAASLGSSPWRAFRTVMLPSIMPGVASGALFAFAASFDEVVVALFVAGPGQRTLPRQLFAGLRESISPAVTAVATLLLLVSALLLGAATLARSRRPDRGAPLAAETDAKG